MREQDVADLVVGGVVPRNPLLLHESRLQPEVRRDGRDLARVVGLVAADRHDRVGAGGEDVGDDVLELAHLVAAEREAAVHVLAFRPDLRAPEVVAQARQVLQRARAEGERVARELVQLHAGSCSVGAGEMMRDCHVLSARRAAPSASPATHQAVMPLSGGGRFVGGEPQPLHAAQDRLIAGDDGRGGRIRAHVEGDAVKARIRLEGAVEVAGAQRGTKRRVRRAHRIEVAGRHARCRRADGKACRAPTTACASRRAPGSIGATTVERPVSPARARPERVRAAPLARACD
jgi:hypothetical protein